MPGTQDPNLWQQLADSRFVQTLVSALGMAAAVGYAVARFLKRYTPKNDEEATLKDRLETGVLREIAHQLNDIRKEQAELGERVATIEGYLRSEKGA